MTLSSISPRVESSSFVCSVDCRFTCVDCVAVMACCIAVRGTRGAQRFLFFFYVSALPLAASGVSAPHFRGFRKNLGSLGMSLCLLFGAAVFLCFACVPSPGDVSKESVLLGVAFLGKRLCVPCFLSAASEQPATCSSKKDPLLSRPRCLEYVLKIGFSRCAPFDTILVGCGP